MKSHKREHRSGMMIELEGGKSKVTYCVLSGWVSLSKSMPDGQRQIIDFALPGDFLNPRSADNATSTLQIEAVTYAAIAAIPDNLWHRLKESIPNLETLEKRGVQRPELPMQSSSFASGFAPLAKCGIAAFTFR